MINKVHLKLNDSKSRPGREVNVENSWYILPEKAEINLQMGSDCSDLIYRQL